ncbi:MAG: hypothetical protein Q9161_008789 [Pseudevernia consocians]
MDPKLLSIKGWNVPEIVEISKVGDWRHKNLQQDGFAHEKFDIKAFHGTGVELRQLRNRLWHQVPANDTGYICFVHAGICFAIYTDNRVKAIDIEIKAQMKRTRKSREDVLTRLHKVYLTVEPPNDEDDHRRECRRRLWCSVLADTFLWSFPIHGKPVGIMVMVVRR